MITQRTGDLIEFAQNTAAPYSKVVIAHVCNNLGLMGKGFAKQVAETFPEVAERFKRAKPAFQSTLILPSRSPSIYISNMVCMNGLFHRINNPAPLCNDSLKECLRQTKVYAKDLGAQVHMPRIGSGLARGDWNTIRGIIEDVFGESEVFVWDIETKQETEDFVSLYA